MPVFTSSIEVTADYPTIKPSLNLNFLKARALDSRVTLERASAATYIGRDGLVKYAGEDEPRFDHDPDTLESLGLLLEESRTNIAIYGDDMSQYTSVNMTKTANDAVAPDGTTTATKLEHGGGGNTWYLDYSPGNTNASGAGSYTYSVWVKAPDDQPDDYYGCRIAILTSTGNNTETVFSLKKTWSRITITKTYASETGTIRIHPIIFRTSPGNSDGGKVTPSYVWVWGSQWEQGTFATSYIPTHGSTVTRAVDTAVIKGTNFSSWYNASESTIFFESGVAPVNNSKYFTFQGTDGGGTELIEAAAVSGPGANIFTYADSTVHSNISVTDASATALKYAVGVKANDINLAINGTLGTTDTSSTQPDAIDKLIIGNYSTGNYYANTTIKKLSYYPKRLPNAQLQGLTQQ